MSDEGAHARIEAALARLGEDHVPPVGWQARVLAATAEPRRRPWWLLALPAALAIAAAVWVVWPRGRSAPKSLELALAIDRTGVVVRGKSANVGDIVNATARGGSRHRAVWIYREERELVVACPGASACRATADSLVVGVTLQAIGSYTIVALTSDEPIPAPRGSLDTDVANAVAGGATKRTESLVVQ